MCLHLVYFYSCEQKNKPVACGDGSYSKSAQRDCEKCPVGTYCPLLSTELPRPCPKGFYSMKNGSSECIECKRGIQEM